MPSIRDRLAKLPPYEDELPMIQEVKKVAEQQSTYKPPVEKEEPPEPQITEEAASTEVVEPPIEEKVEEKKEEVSERTAEQFDKLKEHNKQLKEEVKVLQENVLDSLKPKPLPTPPPQFEPEVIEKVEKLTAGMPQDKVNDVYANLIDKDGYIDPDLLIKSLRQANEEAKLARQEADMARKEAQEAKQETKKTKQDFEESREVRLVHKKYPTIDPKNKDFNELFWDDVRKEIATAPILKGVAVSFMEAADKIWAERYAPKEVEEVKKKEKEKMEEAENQKRNINASKVSSRTDYYAPTDKDALIEAVQKGKRGALAERLKRSGY